MFHDIIIKIGYLLNNINCNKGAEKFNIVKPKITETIDGQLMSLNKSKVDKLPLINIDCHLILLILNDN